MTDRDELLEGDLIAAMQAAVERGVPLDVALCALARVLMSTARGMAPLAEAAGYDAEPRGLIDWALEQVTAPSLRLVEPEPGPDGGDR